MAQYDVIVVGAGAAGAPLAARLAEGGMRVLVLEAGPDPMAPDAQVEGARDMRADYHVPGFNAFCSENPGIRGDEYVRHYADQDRQQKDWKYVPDQDGVLYPRVKGLGGCASHHAMIIIKPNERDWNNIAQTTGDDSWTAPNMAKYWERVERCRHRFFLWRWLAWLTGWNPTGHGWWGWMQTEWALPLRGLFDRALRRDIIRSMGAAADANPGNALGFTAMRLDPNARRLWNPHSSGVRIAPVSTKNHQRYGARERLLAAMRVPKNKITLELNALVERVEVVDGVARAVIYRQNCKTHRVEAPQIVLSGGTFRTPQVMMLSGLGPADHLREHGIDVVQDLPDVGQHMQDRYEIGVSNEMCDDWGMLKGVEYSTQDKPYWLWKHLGRGPYISNGSLFAVELKSKPELSVPDLFCFSLLVDFQGYYPGYSDRTRSKNYMTWAVLKAYTNNTAGVVRLRSTDPADQVDANFHYFDEGNGDWQADLDAVATGVKFVRDIADSLGNRVKREAGPGRTYSSDEALRQYIKDNAWGHHACGSCAMRPKDQGGVVDSRFNVYGVQGLRIADASIFPKIPGYFLVSAVYMIAEKAADTILEDWREP